MTSQTLPPDSFPLQPSYFLILGQHLLTIWFILRKFIVGTVAVGLFMGAFYFLWYLVRLSRLPTTEREYRFNRHHLEPETLLRYVILITCLIMLNVLFYWYFEFGRESVHVGVIVWALYGVAKWVVKPVMDKAVKKKN